MGAGLWVTLAGTARVESAARAGLHLALDAGAGVAVAVTDAHDGAALIAQTAGETGYWLSSSWLVGLRAIAAGVLVDDTSPIVLSVEPFAEYAHERDLVRVRAGLLLPLLDLGNDDVSPGLGGYRIGDHKALGLSLAASY